MIILSKWDPERVTDLLLSSARVALGGWPTPSWQLKSDGTLVTEKDEAIEALLARSFDASEAGVYMIGEETVATKGDAYLRDALKHTAWIVDPIDGTAPYAHGLTGWGTSIGFARNGVLEHGAVILPATRELFLTSGDQVWWSQQVDLGLGAARPTLHLLEPTLAAWTPGAMVALGQHYVKYRVLPWPNPVVATGCAINVLTYLMLGRVAAYIGHMKLWDVAGVLPMLLRTGLGGCLLDGTSIGAGIDASVYHMGEGDANRWAFRDSCLFAPVASVGFLRNQCLRAASGATSWAE